MNRVLVDQFLIAVDKCLLNYQNWIVTLTPRKEANKRHRLLLS